MISCPRKLTTWRQCWAYPGVNVFEDAPEGGLGGALDVLVDAKLLVLPVHELAGHCAVLLGLEVGFDPADVAMVSSGEREKEKAKERRLSRR